MVSGSAAEAFVSVRFFLRVFRSFSLSHHANRKRLDRLQRVETLIDLAHNAATSESIMQTGRVG